MQQNLDATQGLVFSQTVLLALVETGLTRDEAYRLVQRNAMEAWNGKGHLRDLLADDNEVSLTADDLESLFSTARVSDSISVVFERLKPLSSG